SGWTLLNSIQEGYYEVDLAGTYTFFNSAMSKILGYTEKEMIGMNYRLYMDEETTKKIFRDFNEVYRTGISLKVDYEQIKKDGSTMYAETSVTLMRDSFGQPTGFRGIVRDITERRQMEEALRESAAQYRLLAEHMTDIVWIMDLDLNVTWLSPSAMKARGFSVDEIAALPLDRQLTPESLGKAVNWLGKLMRLEKDGPISEPDGILSRELAFYCKDGRTIVLDCTFQFIRDEQGKATGILAEGKDITARKRAEEELKQSEERYRNIFENAQGGIFQTSLEGRFLTANQALATILGYDSPEDLMTTIINIPKQLYVNPEDRKVLLKMTEEQGSVKGFETQFYRKNGSMIWVSVNQQAVRDAEGRILYYEGFNEDITIKKEGVERIRKALGATVQAMAVTVETRDPYTAGHQRRVADLARSIATEMNLPADQINGIRIAATIHDLGKISVPAEILSKPTKLTALEFSLIKTHPQSGYDILQDIDFPWPIARIVLEHHERMNGSGYPNGLTGDNILLESRILAVADVVESMASHRPYRPSLGIEAALQEIEKNKGTLYDNTVADVCLRVFREKGYQLEGT
ncbi:MAG TPA: PAS domain S-box protein, partial [Syntrophales bacterium]